MELPRERILELFHCADEFAVAKGEPNLCAAAQEFALWIEALCTKAQEAKDVRTVYWFQKLLQDQYHDRRRSVTTDHRDRTGKRGHVCIYHVYLQAFERLKAIELNLMPLEALFPSQRTTSGPVPNLIGFEVQQP